MRIIFEHQSKNACAQLDQWIRHIALGVLDRRQNFHDGFIGSAIRGCPPVKRATPLAIIGIGERNVYPGDQVIWRPTSVEIGGFIRASLRKGPTAFPMLLKTRAAFSK